jgi:hypothetical protein
MISKFFDGSGLLWGAKDGKINNVNLMRI